MKATASPGGHAPSASTPTRALDVSVAPCDWLCTMVQTEIRMTRASIHRHQAIR